MKKYKFGVLGAGNMGTAIAEGAVRAGLFTPAEVLMFAAIVLAQLPDRKTA